MPSSNSRNLTLCVPRTSRSDVTNSVVLVGSEIPQTSQDNYVLIRVDRFGFSANNITYQALGDTPHFRYFDFHDAPETNRISRKTHGLIPVWGFGTVVWTSHKLIEVGERVYGYFAPTRYLLLPVSPSDVSKYAFFASRPHFPRDRRPYNQIIRCRTDPQYDPSPEIEDLTMLYRPLFWTSFWCEDWLAASGFRGRTRNFIISSASSKTAFCLAYLIRERFRENGELPELNIVALTSKKNLAFTRSLQLYNAITEYSNLPELFETITSNGKGSKWIYIDVAGNEQLNENLRSFFSSGNNQVLAAHVSLGLTNLTPAASAASNATWSLNTKLLNATRSDGSTLGNSPLYLPSPETFFMPEWLAVRRTQLSVAQITEMQAKAWAALLRDGRSWVQIEHVYGGHRVQDAYDRAIRDGLEPDRGYIWSLWEDGKAGEAVTAKL